MNVCLGTRSVDEERLGSECIFGDRESIWHGNRMCFVDVKCLGSECVYVCAFCRELERGCGASKIREYTVFCRRGVWIVGK